MAAGRTRCAWCGSDPLYVDYHDTEWGVPVRDDRHLFEMLVLEGAQAGLSWLTILRKREGYRRAFDGFDMEKIAAYSQRDVRRLLADEGIVRNRLKVEAAVRNARGALALAAQYGSLSAFLWRYVDAFVLVAVVRSDSQERSGLPDSPFVADPIQAHGVLFPSRVVVFQDEAAFCTIENRCHLPQGGSRVRTGGDGGRFAYTQPGSRVIFVCGRRFRQKHAWNPVTAEALIIHEMLHALGLGEDPPTSVAITAQVLERCGS